jgi:predicted hydrocarbon binding protein
MENKILKELEFSQSGGELSYKGVRYMLIRPETLIEFQKRAEELLRDKGEELLYQSGFKGGKLSATKYRDFFHLSDEEIVKFMMEMGGEIGWGHFSLVEMDLRKKRMVIDVENSPFAIAYGKSDRPVCHFTRGVLGGKGEVVFRKPVTTSEVQCQAKGNKKCQFIIQVSCVQLE